MERFGYSRERRSQFNSLRTKGIRLGMISLAGAILVACSGQGQAPSRRENDYPPVLADPPGRMPVYPTRDPYEWLRVRELRPTPSPIPPSR